ncbi:MAG: regulatory protein RecX [Alistipes indistinctus]
MREKATLSRWGSYKIRSGLRTKQISEETIAEAVAQLDAHDMSGKLEEQLRRKMRTVKAKNSYDLRTKLLRYGAGLGFDFSEVSDLVERLVQHTDSVGDDF